MVGTTQNTGDAPKLTAEEAKLAAQLLRGEGDRAFDEDDGAHGELAKKLDAIAEHN